MKKYSIYFFLLLIILTSCQRKEITKTHGISYLEKREKLFFINKSNKNDIIKILGTPSTKSKFDKDVWIYIERKQTQSELKNLGKMKIYKNNVLVLEIDDYGILEKKKLYNQDDMKNLKISKDITGKKFKKNSFIYDFMSSLRQKINDPLGKRAKKRKEISQR